jgi:pimeloyl-ACP methyl ester carboxylesterase
VTWSGSGVMRKTLPNRRRRRAWPLWPLFGLAAVGLVAMAIATRRRRFEVFADWDQEAPPEPRAAAVPPSEVPDSHTVATWISGPAGNLMVRDSGETGAPAIVFVHGLGGNGGQWALQLDHLQGRRRTVALDLRGHGDSDPADDGQYEISALATDVAAVADQLPLRRFILVGHSLGAAVAIRYAAEHPGRVEGLVLVDPSGDQTRLPKADAAAFLRALRAAPTSEIESSFRQLLVGGDRDAASWVLEDLRLTDEAAAAGMAAAGLEYSPLPDLARYPGPKVAIVSQLNSLPISLHRLVGDLHVQFVAGAGHWLMMDRPAAFNQLLDDFIEQVDEAAAPT